MQLKKIVEENKSINRIDRAGIIYDNLAKCDAYLLNYSQAIIWSKNAQLCFKAGSRNYWVSLDQELLINIYQRNIPKAEQILVEIYKYQKNDKSVLARNSNPKQFELNGQTPFSIMSSFDVGLAPVLIQTITV